MVLMKDRKIDTRCERDHLEFPTLSSLMIARLVPVTLAKR